MLGRSVFVAAALLSTGALASTWKVNRNERDPFAKDTSTFIASTIEEGSQLFVRCLEGSLSFSVAIDANSTGHTNLAVVQIVADEKDSISASGGVIASTDIETWLQFGDEYVVSYLQGAKKFWVRVNWDSVAFTFPFTGGASFDHVLKRARKACGVPSVEDASPEPEPTPLPPRADATETQTSRSAADECLHAWIKDASVVCPPVR